jgi:hypothetical protein
MKLYPKKLHSLEELKREKHVLKYAKKHTDKEEWLSLDDIKPKGSERLLDAGLIGSVLSALGSKSIFSAVIAVAPPLLGILAKRSGKKNIVERAVRDLAGGYLKWKAVQYSFNTLRNIISASKEKKKASKHS